MMTTMTAKTTPPILDSTNRHHASSNIVHTPPMEWMIVDDGTATIAIATPSSMIKQIQPVLSLGRMMDCIIQRSPQTNGIWTADRLMVLPSNPLGQEALRWCQISHDSNQPSHNNNTNINNNTHWSYGYPSKQVTPHALFQWILWHSQTMENPIHGKGVTIDELALVLQKPTHVLQDMIHELQLSGQIYQNEKGRYVPL